MCNKLKLLKISIVVLLCVLYIATFTMALISNKTISNIIVEKYTWQQVSDPNKADGLKVSFCLNIKNYPYVEKILLGRVY